ncbi:MAG: hypothetical protein JW829_07915 [Pirellulales bacterium]|nr:hypothetical protein [Pirellulales bacterium]
MKPNRQDMPVQEEDPFDRLRRTSLFRGDRFCQWQQTTLGIVGAGVVGYRVGLETILSGARMRVWDFDIGQHVNEGTQFTRKGIRKVDSLVAACDAICPGRAVGMAYDIRHAGIGEIAQLNMLIDCSDDPALAIPLAYLSNGLRIPLLRLAVDGSGEMELGRVLCSHGGAGWACQMCTYDFHDLFRPTQRTPCPGQPINGRPPTIAGGALAAVIGGFGLVQAQRLATGNDLDQVVNREIVLDMTNWCLYPLSRQRSNSCLSGHLCWKLTPIGRVASELTFAELFDEAAIRLSDRQVTLEPYGHAFCIEAICSCGARREVIGTRWAKPPDCLQCHETMRWFDWTQHSILTKETVAELQIDNIPLSEFGLPRAGAMFVARAKGARPLRLLLD